MPFAFLFLIEVSGWDADPPREREDRLSPTISSGSGCDDGPCREGRKGRWNASGTVITTKRRKVPFAVSGFLQDADDAQVVVWNRKNSGAWGPRAFAGGQWPTESPQQTFLDASLPF